jgi:hypothetical protein
LGGKYGKKGKQKARLIIDGVCTTQRFSADFFKGIHTALSSKETHSYLTYLVIFVDALIGQYDGPFDVMFTHLGKSLQWLALNY